MCAKKIITGREKFIIPLMPYLLERELEHVKSAYIFSKYGHRNQISDDGTRVFEHPRSVSNIIIEELELMIWRMIVTALLHDIREDSWILSEYRIRINFGKVVCHWVKLLTKTEGVDYIKCLTDVRIWQVLVVKLSDRLHNLRRLGACTDEKIKRQVKETKEKYYPLTNLLIEIIPRKYIGKAEYLKGEIIKNVNSY
jgi:GTP diphosphokinase / guanosine-3',5'-bis(diphosphate) 3'-diphosphatase